MQWCEIVSYFELIFSLFFLPRALDFQAPTVLLSTNANHCLFASASLLPCYEPASVLKRESRDRQMWMEFTHMRVPSLPVQPLKSWLPGCSTISSENFSLLFLSFYFSLSLVYFISHFFSEEEKG